MYEILKHVLVFQGNFQDFKQKLVFQIFILLIFQNLMQDFNENFMFFTFYTAIIIIDPYQLCIKMLTIIIFIHITIKS